MAYAPAPWVNDDHVMYDCAISWTDGSGAQSVPFLWGTNPEFPYVRRSVPLSEKQVTTSSVGEQALDGWWYRSQTSFSGGQGVEFLDVVDDPTLSNRFEASCNVEVFNQEGQVSLVRDVPWAARKSSANTNLEVLSYTNGGTDGVLFSDGATLSTVNDAGTKTAVTWGGAASIQSITSDGARWYAADQSGIYRGTLPGGAGTQIYSFPANYTNVKLGWAKNRLICGFTDTSNNTWLVALAANPATPPVAINTTTPPAEQTINFQHPSPYWVWSAIADGPGVIYASGYVGDQSSVYSVTLKDDDTMGIPFETMQMPRLEVIYSMISYMGSYLVVGTNNGVRVGTINSDGSLRQGPISQFTNHPVKALAAYNEFILYGGQVNWWLADAITSGGAVVPCISKLDLSRPLKDKYGNETGEYATASYLQPEENNVAATASNNCSSIAMIGDTTRLAFCLPGVGLMLEDDGDSASRGWFITPRIRMDTLEQKLWNYLRVFCGANDGTLEAWYQVNSSTDWVKLFEEDTDALNEIASDASDGFTSSEWIRFLFVFERGDTVTNSPVMTGYQLRCSPSGVRQLDLQLPLLCYYREQTRTGVLTVRPTWDRIKALEAVQRTGSIVRFQNFGTGEDRYCLVEDVQFISTHIPEQRTDEAQPSGLLVLKLRTVDGE